MKDKPVRLKIAVGPKLLAEIKRMSDGLDRSQSWVAAQLLAIMLNDNKRFVSWVAWRLTAGTVQVVKELSALVSFYKGRPEAIEKPTGHLQVYVSEEVVEAIHRNAEALGLSDAEAAGRMLYCSLEVQGWAIEMVMSRIGIAVQELIDIEPAPNEPGNMEPNANLEKHKARKAQKAAGKLNPARRRASA